MATACRYQSSCCTGLQRLLPRRLKVRRRQGQVALPWDTTITGDVGIGPQA